MFDPNIDNINYYNNEMKKSIIDKIFFLDKIDAEIIVDFGCADGTLIQFIEEMFPETICIGYDISETELSIAKQKVKNPDLLFSDWEKLIIFLNKIKENKKTAVICNSLIHEVYAYGNAETVSLFWDRIYNSNFDYIVVRDMCVSETTNRKVDSITLATIKQKANRIMLREFESEWGIIDNCWSMIHFLLKYRYEKNWKREVKENYLPITYETMLQMIPNKYKIDYIDHFILPFINNQIEKDFGIKLQDNTHLKLILKRN